MVAEEEEVGEGRIGEGKGGEGRGGSHLKRTYFVSGVNGRRRLDKRPLCADYRCEICRQIAR